MISSSVWKSTTRITFFTLLSFVLLFSGCDSGNDDFVFINNNNGNAGQAGVFDLEVGFDPAALAREIRAQIGADVTQFRAILIDSNDTRIDEQTAARNQTVVFRGLAPGDYLVRYEGLDAGGNIVGFFDRIVSITNSRVTSLLPGLRLDPTPPAASFAGTQGSTQPFFVLTDVPTTAQGITGFSVSAQVFDGQGNLPTSATTGVSLTSSNLNFETAVANQDTNGTGAVVFNGVRFEEMANGTTTLTVDAAGVDSATSPDITVTPPGSFFATLELVSKSTAGVVGDSFVFSGSVSGDGRYVAFDSNATNLVGSDTNGNRDLFLRDRQLNTLVAISVNTQGQLADGDSNDPDFSADGNFVAFTSSATDLVPNDTNGEDDIFVYDRQQQTIERVSILSNGTEADGSAFCPVISGDGRIVVFLSQAENFDEGPTNNRTDLFAYDRQTDTLERINVPAGIGLELRPAISGDGRYVAFTSPNPEGLTDTNGTTQDVFIFDRTTDTMSFGSTDAAGDQTPSGNTSQKPHLSTDGRYLAFESRFNFGFTPDDADFDIFVKDLQTGAVERVSQDNAGNTANENCDRPLISGDGRFVIFTTDSNNLVTDGNSTDDVFLFDRTTDMIERVSVDSTGGEISSSSGHRGFSSDGRFVLFVNNEDSLVPEDDNGVRDMFTIINPFRR